MQQLRLIILLIAAGINPLFAEPLTSPKLGLSVSKEEVARWELNVFPDGEGLPTGQGTAAQGEQIYQQQCLVCHDKNGLGASADQLAGAQMALTSDYPEKTIGSYWPYATTLFDFIRRAMPMNNPNSLTDSQTYAVTAYLLYLNHLIGKDETLNARTLTKIEMPNKNGFINVYEGE